MEYKEHKLYPTPEDCIHFWEDNSISSYDAGPFGESEHTPTLEQCRGKFGYLTFVQLEGKVFCIEYLEAKLKDMERNYTKRWNKVANLVMTGRNKLLEKSRKEWNKAPWLKD